MSRQDVLDTIWRRMTSGSLWLDRLNEMAQLHCMTVHRFHECCCITGLGGVEGWQAGRYGPATESGPRP